MEKITGILTVLQKLPLSRMGNPKYIIAIDNKIFETKTNAMLGYSITNYDNKKVNANFEDNKLVNVENFYQSKIRGV